MPRNKLIITIYVLILCFFKVNIIFAQAPSFYYSPPPFFTVNTAINTLLPVNNGGPAPDGSLGKIITLAGTGTQGTINGSGISATLHQPSAVAFDKSNNVYVVDKGNSVIRKVSTDGNVTTLAGSGTAAFADGTGTSASFNQPYDLTVDGAGNLYVTDLDNNRIRKVTTQGVVTTIAGNGTAGSDNGTGTVATFNQPAAIAMDNAGNLYVTDSGSNLIRKITTAGVVTTMAGSGGTGRSDGPVTSASFNGPFGIAVDAGGNVFVADSYNSLIRKINPAGVVSTFAGGTTFGHADGTGTAASFHDPIGLTIDANGNLYVADAQNNSIRKITPTAMVSTVSGSNGSGSATFNTPYGVVGDADGNLYVADTNNNLVKKIIANIYTIDKPLPAGLTFDKATGKIRGTPTITSAPTAYKVTAYNKDGNYTTTITIEVRDNAAFSNPVVKAPDISYNPADNVYRPNTPIATLIPNNKGGAVPPNVYGQVSTFAGNATAVSVDGTGPTAGFNFPNYLVRNAAGLIYVTDGNKLIREITPDGVVTTLAGSSLGFADGQGKDAQFNAPAGMAIDAAGNIYVVDSNNARLREVAPDGSVTTINGIGFVRPNGLVIDAAGNLYISDYADNTIRKLTASGTASTFAGLSSTVGSANGTGTDARFNGPNYMAIDAAGNIYVSDFNNNLIRKITAAGVVTTLAGSGQHGSDNGIGDAASFDGPEGLAIGTDGSIYVSDAGNNMVRKISPSGEVTTLAGNGKAALKDGFDLKTSFNTPHGLVTDGDGNLLCADVENNVIRKIITTGYVIDKKLPPGLTFNAKTGQISGTPTAIWPATVYTITGINATGSSSTKVTIEVNNNGVPDNNPPKITYETPKTYFINQTITPLAPTQLGSLVPDLEFGQTLTLSGSGDNGNNNGDAITSSFSQPAGVAVDAAGNIYVADFLNNLIRKVTPDGATITFAGSDSPGVSNGTGSAASFNGPSSIVIDGAGNLYVADSKNDRIRKITPAGVVTTFAGEFVGKTDGNGTAASFNDPQGIAIDAAGNLYVADTFNNLIRKISPTGDVITLAGDGSPGSANNVNGKAASFNAPQNLTVDAAGNVYVTDSGNNLIRKITPAGAVSTYAGTGFPGGVNGPALSASFNKPGGIVVDDIGNLFISDFDGNLIRMIDPSGNVITLAGDGTPGSLNNTGTVASFHGPKGLALDADRKLYIADSFNNEIRTTYTVGYRIDKPLPSGLIFDNHTGTISGTPSALSPSTLYTITAYNIHGSSSFTVDIKVIDSQTITFPPIADITVCAVDFDPGATSNSPITYTSSNPLVATIVAGKVHIIGPGTTTITASDGLTTNSQPLTVIPGPIPSITISPITFDECPGVAVTYTATPVNGGQTPHYQWKVNGQNQGQDIPQFTSSNLNNNDKITCELTTNVLCAASTTATSNVAVFTLDLPVSTSVTIVSSLTGPVCAGTDILFTATPADPDVNLDYHWMVNGNPAGTNSGKFSSATLADGDVVTCILTSKGKCLASPSMPSNAITVKLSPVNQCVIVVPSAFTPNGDGINDLWIISALQSYPYCSITIFTRYGSLIYKSTGYSKAWDGTYNSSALPAGTYYYMIDLKNGKKPLSGPVTLIR